MFIFLVNLYVLFLQPACYLTESDISLEKGCVQKAVQLFKGLQNPTCQTINITYTDGKTNLCSETNSSKSICTMDTLRDSSNKVKFKLEFSGVDYTFIELEEQFNTNCQYSEKDLAIECTISESEKHYKDCIFDKCLKEDESSDSVISGFDYPTVEVYLYLVVGLSAFVAGVLFTLLISYLIFKRHCNRHCNSDIQKRVDDIQKESFDKNDKSAPTDVYQDLDDSLLSNIPGDKHVEGKEHVQEKAMNNDHIYNHLHEKENPDKRNTYDQCRPHSPQRSLKRDQIKPTIPRKPSHAKVTPETTPNENNYFILESQKSQ